MSRFKLFVITLLLGEFGVHKFIRKQYGLGVLYFFTFGLFGIGWMVDTIAALFDIFTKRKTDPIISNKYLSTSELLEWQKLIMPGTNKLVLSRSQLMRYSEDALQRHAQIADDCQDLIRTTVNIDVFFSRYDTLMNELGFLKRLEAYTNFKSDILDDCLNEYIINKQNYIIDFIDRAWEKAILKADALKTEKGKKNQFTKLVAQLDMYSDHMTEETRKYYKSKYAKRYPGENKDINDEINIMPDNTTFKVDD